MLDSSVNRQPDKKESNKSRKREPEPVLTQRGYSPTPYKPSDWEVIGERRDKDDFMGMVLEVMNDKRRRTDPMFETFGKESEFASCTQWESPGGVRRITDKVEDDEEPQIDWKVVEEQLKQKYEEGWQAGCEEGSKRTEGTIVERYQALSTKLAQVTKAVETQVAEHMAKIEKQALFFALEISKKIIETTVEVRPDYIMQIIRSGLKQLGAAKPIRVRVSLQDYEFLEVIGLPNDLTPSELGISYVSDPALKSGCVIETDFGEVNLELDRMWEQIKDSLYSVAK
jgi:flagellar biosynthesis/type III secretory pathway protein FliH